MLGIYNGIFYIKQLSKSKNDDVSKTEEIPKELDEQDPETLTAETDEDVSADASLQKAIDTYRKIREINTELTEKELEELDKKCEQIRQREIIEKDSKHEPIELESDNKVLMGPPTLTRFEKARIMGARALQLSLGAPPFIDIPKNATTSLQIAMEELDLRVIPITIRRVQPNGDFQNIPLINFK